MKVLILVRHAKSSWKQSHLPDHQRPLNKRGERDAPMMGERLAERGVEVDRILSSPAVRALTTAEVIAEKLGYPHDEIIVDEMLYHAGVNDLLEVIQGLDDDWGCVMCFGHNPGLTAFVNWIAPYHHIVNVPTCGVVELEFDTDTWADAGRARSVHLDFDYPKKGS
jgi:phosphohistidine phosphatase